MSLTLGKSKCQKPDHIVVCTTLTKFSKFSALNPQTGGTNPVADTIKEKILKQDHMEWLAMPF
jgi:hypothetical protein